ncbi:glutamate receptor ionotropic, NMDA 2B-like [Schistocerca serialis cubense]|uniref:glutamate receptor ionotropic, NMDA 2B-like n=1 Tax=Schistocerca serialis cubense TaxID=2023355 RepID=UPI00214EDCB9|nr:glutamate receptor ionotropic, NMDA 2B-like [Schistocerca serialis cubense]
MQTLRHWCHSSRYVAVQQILVCAADQTRDSSRLVPLPQPATQLGVAAANLRRNPKWRSHDRLRAFACGILSTVLPRTHWPRPDKGLNSILNEESRIAVQCSAQTYLSAGDKYLRPFASAILSSLCTEFLSVNVSAILYLMNYEKYGRSTASAQYFLQLAGYLGIPVIAWNADNSGLERRASQSSLQLQLAPSLEHQTAAMLSILERYKWHQFSVVTSQIAGHDDFVQALRERITEMQDRFKFNILNTILVTKPGDLQELVNSESRVMLLYSTREEAVHILKAARDLKITGENYVWVVTQSVIENRETPSHFPVGMLGVHFDTSSSSLVNEITTAIKVYAYGVEDFVNDARNADLSLNTQLSCHGAGDSRWKTGDRFFRYLRNVSVEGEQGKPNIEFTPEGVLKAAELKIMNLRPGVSKQLVWEEVSAIKRNNTS